jgi:hypothetical protein
MVKDIFPKFKKKISDFVSQEEGKITKQSALALGAFVFGAVVSSIKNVEAHHSHGNSYNSWAWNSGNGDFSVKHAHHSSHSTHSTHGSHSSHGTHGSHGSHASY